VHFYWPVADLRILDANIALGAQVAALVAQPAPSALMHNYPDHHASQALD